MSNLRRHSATLIQFHSQRFCVQIEQSRNMVVVSLFNLPSNRRFFFSLTLISIASNKWITGKASCTATDWIVINYFTECILAACVRARVCTFLLNACFVLWTFATNYTFGTTLWRYTNIIGLTRANCMTVHFMAMTIWTAWCWFTRVRIWRWSN